MKISLDIKIFLEILFVSTWHRFLLNVYIHNVNITNEELKFLLIVWLAFLLIGNFVFYKNIDLLTRLTFNGWLILSFAGILLYLFNVNVSYKSLYFIMLIIFFYSYYLLSKHR